jgi:uncharacterized protein
LINHEASPGVSTLDAAAAERLIAAASVAWAAVENDSIVGYLIAMLAAAHYDGEEFIWFKQRGEHFVYVDQIALDHYAEAAASVACCTRASRLGAQGIDAEHNLVPPNPRSWAFHARRGFIEVGRMLTSDSRRVALLERDIH